MTELLIKKNDSGQRLDRFLVKAFPQFSQGFIRKSIRDKRIKVGGKRTQADYRLAEQDTVQLYISDSMLTGREKTNTSSCSELNILYEDENIILMDKPVGLVVHEDNDNSSDTLVNRLINYLTEKGEYTAHDELTFRPALCNRIDRNTGGLVIGAKNAETLRIVSQKIHDRELKKFYLCVVAGVMKQINDFITLTAFLEKKAAQNEVIVSNRKTSSNLTIKTAYRVIDIRENNSLLEVDLLTGRTHQIRAHMAFLGFPLLGDGKYGVNKLNKEYNYKTQALYSYKLRFDFVTDAGMLNYLNGKSFEVDKENIWFLKKFYS